ncbi:MAG: MmcQ/YjbR family DNA-binding protein [Anaerolineae bacterium]|nr:MmcQ/YjbR family DNA-binding protein [Anaerolineae bacterium]
MTQLDRVRMICMALPGVSEKLSHGEPTFFVGKKVFTMFANNHHNDGHVAVWLPVPPGFQDLLIATAPAIYFRPPYVGGRGWVGIELAAIADTELSDHIREAWRLVAPKKLQALLV